LGETYILKEAKFFSALSCIKSLVLENDIRALKITYIEKKVKKEKESSIEIIGIMINIVIKVLVSL